jgi:hypothetical protein
MSLPPKENKKYWQGRMTEKVKQAMRQADWIYDEMMETSKHAGVNQVNVKQALEIIGAGFKALLDAVNEVIPTTPEGVPDLGQVHEKEEFKP